jgi:hypothetical protein
MQNRGHPADVVGSLTLRLDRREIDTGAMSRRELHFEIVKMLHLIQQQRVSRERPMWIERGLRRLGHADYVRLVSHGSS